MYNWIVLISELTVTGKFLITACLVVLVNFVVLRLEFFFNYWMTLEIWFKIVFIINYADISPEEV